MTVKNHEALEPIFSITNEVLIQKLSGVRRTRYDDKPRNQTVECWIKDCVRFKLDVMVHKGWGSRLGPKPGSGRSSFELCRPRAFHENSKFVILK